MVSAEFIVEGVLMLGVASVGVVLNIISVFYFAQLKHQRTFHRLLLILALVDTIHLVFSSLTFSIPHLSESYSNYQWMYLVPYSLPLAQTSLTASVYMTISLTMERYFSVVCPFKQFKNRWMRSSFLLSFPSLLFSLVFTLPHYFQLKTVMEEDLTLLSEDNDFWKVLGGYPNMSILAELNADNPTHLLNPAMNLSITYLNNCTYSVEDHSDSIRLKIVNQTVYRAGDPLLVPSIAFASYREDPTYIRVSMWLHLIFNTILPMTVLLFLNTAIYRKLNQPLGRSTESSLHKRERRLARISLLIVLIFIICHSVKNIPSMFEILGHDPRQIPICSQLLLVGHLLLTFNSSVNSLIYYLGNCRKVVRILFSCCNRKMLGNERSFSDHPTLSTQCSVVSQSHAWTERRETSL